MQTFEENLPSCNKRGKYQEDSFAPSSFLLVLNAVKTLFSDEI